MNQAATAAPELLPGLTWLNAEPQTIGGHRGRVLALVFWNAASPYCHNLIDDLVRLQARHPLALSLVGLHQPRFDTEQDAQRVLKAVNRLGITFPVANDPHWVAWQHYGVQSWPTVALVDPRGRLREVFAGDQRIAAIDTAVAALVAEAGGTFAPAPAARPRGAETRLPLAFPSGLAVGENHLYVADTGHHRILECTHSGRLLREFGTGHGDLVDGVEEAAFRAPRGLCLVREQLYVADTGNHALRRIRLLDGAVETVIGNGRAGSPREASGADIAAVALNAPYDVAGTLDRLYLAMAGTNQIWEYDLQQAKFRCLAGAGDLGIADGHARSALFAHPVALAMVQQTLYVVDSASSALRAIQTAQGQVQTLVGQGLYDFGDTDGQRRDARLQLPMGLALDPSSPVLWVADSYNGSLRKLRLGGGDMGTHSLAQPLQQPVALAAGAGSLWIADAGAHEVLRLDLGTGKLTRLPIGE